MSFGKIHRVFIRGYQRGGYVGANQGGNTWVYPYIYCFQNACHIRANHNRAKTRVIFAFILIGTRQNALYFNGFEAAAPCKGRGISAQGRVNGVNDTLAPPRLGFITFAPCRGNMSKMGQRPSTHTGELSGESHGGIIGRITRFYPYIIYIVFKTHANPRFTSVGCRGGRCPYSDVLPLQGAIPFKPWSWGNPGCRSLRSLYPGLRYHCPYRAPRIQNH